MFIVPLFHQTAARHKTEFQCSAVVVWPLSALIAPIVLAFVVYQCLKPIL